MNTEPNPIDLRMLKTLIYEGVQSIQSGVKDHEAILFIGDTGVGKSTIMSFLNGNQLIVKFDGLKTYLDSVGPAKIKIGHQKYSQTSIPTQVSINGMACFDCPGFKDNKGQQFQIANSFFIQRLFDIYGRVKIVLIVDESHISQARADKLPRLIKNMHQSLGSFEDVKDGCCIIVNRAQTEADQSDYQEQLHSIIKMQNQGGHLFDKQERNFLKYILDMKRLMIFRKVSRSKQNQIYVPGECQQKISHCISTMHFAKSRHIRNIISQSAKIAIHDFIDEIQNLSTKKIQLICAELLQIYTKRIHIYGKDLDRVVEMKQQIQKLIEQIRIASHDQIVHILQRQIPVEDLIDFQTDFASVMFFKNIYDKTQVYINNLKTRIQSQLSYLTVKVDKRIIILQEQQKKALQKQRLELQARQKQQRKQSIRIKIMQLSDGLDTIKIQTSNKCIQKMHNIETLKNKTKQISDFVRRLNQTKSQLRDLAQMRLNLQKQYINLQSKTISVGQFV